MNAPAMLIERGRLELEAGARRGFMQPYAWERAAMVRCEAGHVEHHARRSNGPDYSPPLCRRTGCNAFAYLTFPSDVDGPLREATPAVEG